MKKRERTMVSLGLAGAVMVLSLVSLIASFVARPTQPEVVEQASNEQVEAPAAEPEAEQQTEPDQREVFVATWAERIDAFNAGYPLEGYGRTFAEAAYDYGVDPRFSPAIAMVESGAGMNCAYACNAWGWGSQSWPDWDTAIYAHVSGLAANYGSTLSYGIAQTYNELDPDGWYAQVEQCMYQIWESDSL